ncbi:MAG TPA: alpha/beta hydrolase [Candidatus Sulfotelmatobacter sp.]|nr:alpha/beta hydrolase [Candidatus Sulfotelmatobacter sp.]
MNRTRFIGTTVGALAASAIPLAADASETDIALQTPTGSIAGTLTLPSDGPCPVVLIVAGSGPVDRNGNSGPIRADTYALLAAALAARGIASVRYDKRGVAGSAAAATSEAALRFETYIDDAAAWLRLLDADHRFTRVVLAGHSEGAMVGLVAVQHAPAAAYVSLEGPGRPIPTVLREQLEPKLPPDLYAKADAITTALQAGKTVDNVPPELWSLFRTSVQPYLISWFRYVPADEIAKVRIPTTIVQGTADVQVSMVDANALAKAQPAAKLDVIDGMNHMLKHAPDTSSQAAILAGYTDASLPIVPQAVDAVASAAG